MVGFPNKPMGFPTKNDQHLGCEMGGKPTISGNTPKKKSNLHNLHGVLEVQRFPLRFSDMASGQPAAGTVVGKLTSN